MKHPMKVNRGLPKVKDPLHLTCCQPQILHQGATIPGRHSKNGNACVPTGPRQGQDEKQTGRPPINFSAWKRSWPQPPRINTCLSRSVKSRAHKTKESGAKCCGTNGSRPRGASAMKRSSSRQCSKKKHLMPFTSQGPHQAAQLAANKHSSPPASHPKEHFKRRWARGAKQGKSRSFPTTFMNQQGRSTKLQASKRSPASAPANLLTQTAFQSSTRKKSTSVMPTRQKSWCQGVSSSEEHSRHCSPPPCRTVPTENLRPPKGSIFFSLFLFLFHSTLHTASQQRVRQKLAILSRRTALIASPPPASPKGTPNPEGHSKPRRASTSSFALMFSFFFFLLSSMLGALLDSTQLRLTRGLCACADT